MRQIASAIVLLSVITLIGSAQSPARDITLVQTGTGSIRGRVLAAGTDAPLRNARVQPTAAVGSVPAVFTDGEGRFVCTSLAAGQYRLCHQARLRHDEHWRSTFRRYRDTSGGRRPRHR